MAEKFYAVRKGLTPGIYRTWDECKANTHGFSGAEYKSFPTLQEAQNYMNGGNMTEDAGDYVAIYVDGSYNVATQEFSYGMVVLQGESEECFFCKYDDKELSSMHNVAGEIKGAEAAMRYALDKGIPKIAIYHDYEGIAKWPLGEWKTNKEGTKAYKAFFDEVSKQIKIKFVKVAGHSNNKYNDMADRLAKDALGIE